jgi:hypothetical protein
MKYKIVARHIRLISVCVIRPHGLTIFDSEPCFVDFQFPREIQPESKIPGKLGCWARRAVAIF